MSTHSIDHPYYLEIAAGSKLYQEWKRNYSDTQDIYDFVKSRGMSLISQSPTDFIYQWGTVLFVVNKAAQYAIFYTNLAHYNTVHNLSN